MNWNWDCLSCLCQLKLVDYQDLSATVPNMKMHLNCSDLAPPFPWNLPSASISSSQPYSSSSQSYTYQPSSQQSSTSHSSLSSAWPHPSSASAHPCSIWPWTILSFTPCFGYQVTSLFCLCSWSMMFASLGSALLLSPAGWWVQSSFGLVRLRLLFQDLEVSYLVLLILICFLSFSSFCFLGLLYSVRSLHSHAFLNWLLRRWCLGAFIVYPFLIVSQDCFLSILLFSLENRKIYRPFCLSVDRILGYVCLLCCLWIAYNTWIWMEKRSSAWNSEQLFPSVALSFSEAMDSPSLPLQWLHAQGSSRPMLVFLFSQLIPKWLVFPLAWLWPTTPSGNHRQMDPTFFSSPLFPSAALSDVSPADQFAPAGRSSNRWHLLSETAAFCAVRNPWLPWLFHIVLFPFWKPHCKACAHSCFRLASTVSNCSGNETSLDYTWTDTRHPWSSSCWTWTAFLVDLLLWDLEYVSWICPF